MSIKSLLMFFIIVNALSSFAQSLPENEISNSIRENSKKKCTVYKDSCGIKTLYYELYYNSVGLNVKRIMGKDIDEYEYNEERKLIFWSFCLDGDSLWCFQNNYIYNKQGLLEKVLWKPMPLNKDKMDSTIYVYKDTLLKEKLFYKDGHILTKIEIKNEVTKTGKTVTERRFEIDKIVETQTYKYDLKGQMIFHRIQFTNNQALFSMYFKYDSLGREIEYTTYTGWDDTSKETTKTFYQSNGLVARVETPDFTLYYQYE